MWYLYTIMYNFLYYTRILLNKNIQISTDDQKIPLFRSSILSGHEIFIKRIVGARAKRG